MYVRTFIEHVFVDAPSDTYVIRTKSLAASYSYLLGIYLGDGHITRHPRDVCCLTIYMDARYLAVIEEVAGAIGAVMPANKVSIRPDPVWNSVRIGCYSKTWPSLFPQHGAGRKHERRIMLARWQVAITSAYPRELIRGLIHSDGSRFLARQRVGGRIYTYPRYCFKNRSRDILGIFCKHLDMLDIRWTMTGPEQAQIAQRESVQALDEFVGAKR